MASALATAGSTVEVRSRADGLDGLGDATVLLCVPDTEIAGLSDKLAELPERPALVGHTSGATGLAPLASSAVKGTFSVHPLQTVPDGSTDLTGCPAAIAGSDAKALEIAAGMATMAGMTPFEVADEDRAVYHAAASIASNYLVTVEQTAAELLDGIDVGDARAILGPLVRRSLENWLERGPEALTGPIARGDESTVEAHRRALAGRRPELVAFYDALAGRTREIATAGSPA